MGWHGDDRFACESTGVDVVEACIETLHVVRVLRKTTGIAEVEIVGNVEVRNVLIWASWN